MQFKIVVVNERSQDAQSMGYFSGKCDYMLPHITGLEETTYSKRRP